MNSSLHLYIENEILSRYRAFDAAHRIDHARTVIERSLELAARCKADPDTVLRRTIQYGLEHYPDLDREGQYARCCDHLLRKYADGGYLRLWIPDSDNGRKLEELRLLIRRREELRRRFEVIYGQETAC